jgi:hypothetical protein
VKIRRFLVAGSAAAAIALGLPVLSVADDPQSYSCKALKDPPLSSCPFEASCTGVTYRVEADDACKIRCQIPDPNNPGQNIDQGGADCGPPTIIQ